MVPTEQAAACSELLALYAKHNFRLLFWERKGTDIRDWKGPRVPEWNRRDKEYDLSQYDQSRDNLGFFTGHEIAPGKKVVDVDLDWAPGVRLAKAFFPETGFGFGRQGKPLSHLLYTIPDRLKVIVYADVDEGVTFVELRCGDSSHMTMVAPSLHSPGVYIELVEGSSIAHVSVEVLTQALLDYGIACILLKHLPGGLHHDGRLALAGMLLRANFAPERVQRIGEEICRIQIADGVPDMSHRDIADMAAVVATTQSRLTTTKRCVGAGKLAEFIGERGKAVVARIRQWLADAGTASDVESDDAFPMTEAGDAEFFVNFVADRVRYNHRNGRWLVFEGHRWQPQASGEVLRLALESIRARQRAAIGDKDRLKWALGGESRNRLNNLLAIAQTIQPVADSGEHWDEDPWLLAAPNGVIDLRTGTLRDGQPEDRITLQTRIPFDPDAECPAFDKALREIFEENEELIGYFDRYVGYSLTGDCREESLALCWGDGANGKGTLMNTIGWMLGDYADDLPFSAFEIQTRASVPNDVAKIVGKRFITASESGEAQRLNEARIKALTGRDPITARFLHKEFFTFDPVAKFWLASNHKPTIRDDSEGFWRRLHLIPFTASFVGKEDRTLKTKLREEGPGILVRAVRGCLAWQREGLKPPQIILDATKSYRAESMPLTRFIEECCVEKEGISAKFGDLFDAYKNWCKGAKEQARMSRPQFIEALKERYGEPEVADDKSYYKGVGILAPSSRGEL